ncbi:MAG: energy transducer TonB [Candidatus Eremiobacteraeota bacterium]|nr:energy transducer TonB [Candidatus Eremiobacteraeota bacterium]
MATNNAPQSPVPPAERAKNFLLYGFAISLVLHGVFGPLIKLNNTQAQEEAPQKVTVVRVPTPPPTPPPTPTPHPTLPPTPPPKATPPPQQTPAPVQPKIKINTQKTESKSNTGPTENTNKYTTGNTQGVPQGQGTSAPSTAAPAPPAPPTQPPPTPKPTPTPLSCARPNVPATTLRAVEPDTPPMAQQQGISGQVQVIVALDEGSHITSVSIGSSPSAVLNQAALSAARQSTFQTEIKDCKPIAARYLFTVDFTSQ